ncbi:hypothetical protein O3301_16915 [Janthinobacterium sp. SUN211]|uniref:hypothetical protein n=1 Tax=Janthinobacterium sp. SUN211 TaxID=3014786 RepID=UPI00271239EF|nr:hypothetical protein [Janthinobacterium sp. SUN211]MDO8050153.1 hypothetical protein [Janthinobacterium sp. SUN211]
MERTQQIFAQYHRFDDGALVSFEQAYGPRGVQSVRIVLCARNHELEGNIWRKVAITVGDVRELMMKTPGNFINRICCGVKLLRFGDVWCVDIDGTYAHDEPATLEEVRRDGDCYVIGGTVEAIELD